MWFGARQHVGVRRWRDKLHRHIASMVGIASVLILTAVPATAASAVNCGGTVSADAPAAREINLVIDDSGSMFSDGSTSRDRWSEAKYSLEVFAAMLEQDDSLNVYRMSDFADGAVAGPQVQLTGSEPASSRVAKIHAMQMVGGGTPYSPVQRAYADLTAGNAPNKWLVILTDGAFDDRSTQDVNADLHRFATKSATSSLQVAFLGISNEAATIPDDPANGIHSAHAASSADLLDLMTGFSNLIFERNLIKQSSPGHISPDIPLAQALIFAQGQSVTIGSATNSGKSTAPSSVVDVSWAENQPALSDGAQVAAVPNKSLRGKIASFKNVPKGDTVFDIKGAQTIDIFYKPRVSFGIQLHDASGKKIAADKLVGGKYTLKYGFMDQRCNFVQSELLGTVDYSAKILRNGEAVANDFAPGDTVSLERGSVVIDANARFLGIDTSHAKIDLRVLEPARPSGFRVLNTRFMASKLQQYEAPKHAIALIYEVKNGTSFTPFSANEWKTITPASFHVTSSSNLSFKVVLGDQVGQVYLVPRAPHGDVYAADTGKIPIQVNASHVFDEQLNQTKLSTATTVVDDLPWYARFGHWFAEMGWKFLIALLALVVLLGYLFKRRFSKKVRKRPTIIGTPNRVGVREETSYGKFTVKPLRKLLPFVPDAATLRYVPPGVAMFRPMKLKAGPKRTMVIENWRDIAGRKNVAVNGIDLDDDTRKSPTLGPSSTVTASTPQLTYELTPNV
jgi:hypothetical protein